MITFSIVVPVLNGASGIADTLTAIVTQERPPEEIIIADGGSSDDTLIIAKNILERAKSDYVISSLKDGGIYAGMNRGIALSRQDVVGICNVGDAYYPWALKVVERAFLMNPFVEVVHGRQIDRAGDRCSVRPLTPADLWWKAMPFHHSTMFVKRLLYRSLTFNERLRSAADLEFVYEILRKNVQVAAVDCGISEFALGGFSQRNLWLSIREQRQVRSRYYGGRRAWAIWCQRAVREGILYPAKHALAAGILGRTAYERVLASRGRKRADSALTRDQCRIEEERRANALLQTLL